MANDMALLSLPVSLPPVPPAAPQEAKSALDTSSGNEAENTASTDQNAASGGGQKSFSSLLQNHEPPASPAPKTANAKTPVSSTTRAAPASDKSTKDADAADDANNSNASASAASPSDQPAAQPLVPDTTLLATLMLTQLQASSATPSTASVTATDTATVTATDTAAATPTQAASATDTSTAATPSDTLAQLQQLLQQLLQLAQKAQPAQPQAAPATADASGKTAAQGSDAKDDSDTALNAIVSQLTALLQQLAPLTAASPSAADASDTDTAAPGIQSTGADAALLAQLTRALGQQLNASPAGQASAANTPAGGDGKDSAASNSTPLPASFDATLSALLKQPDTTSKLQTLLSQVTDLLTPPTHATTDSAQDKSSTIASAGLVPPAAPIQSAPDSGFAKLVNEVSSTAATPATQVAVQIKNAVADGASQIKIQLSPEDMGKVVVQLTTSADGKTGVTVTADNRQTLALLQNEARALESSLRDIGLKTDSGSLSFNLSGQQQQQQSPGKNSGYTQIAAASDDDDIQALSSSTTLYRLSAVSGLDIRV